MIQAKKPSTSIVAGINSSAIAHYREMRHAFLNAPGIDRTMCEVVITAQLALLGHEIPFKIHALRLKELNVSKEQLQHVLLAGVGVTCVVCEAARAIEWLDQAYQQQSEFGAT